MDINIVPVFVGAIDQDEEAAFGALLAPYLARSDTICVVSSDFCHWWGILAVKFRDELIPVFHYFQGDPLHIHRLLLGATTHNFSTSPLSCYAITPIILNLPYPCFHLCARSWSDGVIDPAPFHWLWSACPIYRIPRKDQKYYLWTTSYRRSTWCFGSTRREGGTGREGSRFHYQVGAVWTK